MKRCLLSAVCLFLLLPATSAIAQCPPGAGYCLTRPAPVARAAPLAAPVVSVTNSQKSAASVGLGAVVGACETHSVVLTCWHIFRDGAGTVTVTANGRTIPAKLVGTDQANDLAAVTVAVKLRSLTVGDAHPPAGETLWLAGRGGWRRGTLRGFVQSGGQPERSTGQITGAAGGGDSGGPVIWKRRLVGVLWGTADGHSYATIGYRCGPIRRFLGRLTAWLKCQPVKPQHLPPRLRPLAKPAVPPAEPAVAAEIAALRKDVAELRRAIAKLEPVVGPAGPPGPKGEPGPRGPEGPALPCPELPPTTIQILDQDNNVIDSEQFRIGGVIKIRLKPVTK